MRLAILGKCVAILLASAAAASAESGLQYPTALSASHQRIFVADRQAQVIWAVEAQKLRVFFKGSGRFRTPLAAVQSLAVDSEGRLLAGDSATREVYRFDRDGRPVPLTAGKIGIPSGIAVNGEGTIFVADLETARIWKVPKDGGEPAEFAAIAAPRAVAFDRDGNLWVVSQGKNQLVRLTSEGEPTVVVEGRPFQFPLGLAVDPDGNAFVDDAYAGIIWRVLPSKKVEKFAAGGGLQHPAGLLWHGDGLLVADPKAKAVFRLDGKGRVEPLPLTVP